MIALWDATPAVTDDPVVVVVTPGFAVEGFLPLVRALARDGHDVQVASFPCGAGDTAALAEALGAADLPEGATVIAHGLGAPIALRAPLDADRYVLLAPVLDVWPVAATAWLAGQEIGPSLVLDRPLDWRGTDVRRVLLGEAPPLGCVPVGFARDVQGWILEGAVPLDLGAIEVPVRIAVSPADEVATLEATVPAARALPDGRVVRLGLTRMQGRDFTHGEMLRARAPVRWAVRASRR